MSDATEPKTKLHDFFAAIFLWAKEENFYCKTHYVLLHCHKICARTRHVPQEMLFDIFSRLRAQFLYDVMRHVCREWDLMIRNPNFGPQNLLNSTSGMIIQKSALPSVGIYVEMRRGCLEISEFGQELRFPVWSSCNGLILTRDPGDLRFLYVSDLLTKQRVILPPYFHQIKTHKYFSLAFVEASMEYKVVQARYWRLSPSNSQIAILTVGVDRVWRRMDVQHLSLISKEAFISSPLVTGAYIHWIGTTFVLTLNVETETICQFPLPQSQQGCRKFLPMGGNLSAVCGSSELYRDVWEMNPKSGKWTMLLRFDLGPLICKFQDLFPDRLKFLDPLGWLEVGDVLFLSTKDTQKCCVAYNIKTCEMQSFEVYTLLISYHFQPHVNNQWNGF